MRHAWPVVLPGLFLLFAAPRGGPARAGETGAAVEPEAAWTFDKGGLRDPFTFWKEIPKGPEGPGQGPVDDDKRRRDLQQSAEKSYLVAERAMMDSKHQAAVEACDKGLQELGVLPPETEPAVQELYERLYRLRRAADRLQKRVDAEDAFRRLNIKVSGVVAKQNHPLAIVNNKTVKKGELIETTEGEATVYVDEIQPSRVILRFRGYRIELPLN
jgi:hypothetical protein